MHIITILSSLLLLLGIAQAELPGSLENSLSTLRKVVQVVSTVTTSTGIRAKRSLDQQLTIDEFNRCQNIAHRLACETGLQQDQYHLALECQQQELANVARFACAVNDNGIYCGQGIEISQEFVSETSEHCDANSTSCSPSCRSLISNIRDRLGCCTDYWTSLNISGSHFDGKLWQTCNVSTSELCPLPAFTTSNSATRLCTVSELSRLLIAQRCMQSTSGITVETLANTTGCEGVAKIHVEECDINSEGEFCALDHGVELVIDMIRICGGSLAGDVCLSSCRQSLITLRNALGCCVNTHYNATLTRIAPTVHNAEFIRPFFTNSFWLRCGVIPPGTCKSTLSDNGAVQFSGWISVTLVFVFAALLL